MICGVDVVRADLERCDREPSRPQCADHAGGQRGLPHTARRPGQHDSPHAHHLTRPILQAHCATPEFVLTRRIGHHATVSAPAFGLNRFDFATPDRFATDVARAEALGWDYAFVPDSQLRRHDTYVLLSFAAKATSSIRLGPLL
ncbi:MAG: LLM class flavin-dependent oxidoreductase, partial [Planctomycetota bacterium]